MKWQRDWMEKLTIKRIIVWVYRSSLAFNEHEKEAHIYTKSNILEFYRLFGETNILNKDFLSPQIFLLVACIDYQVSASQCSSEHSYWTVIYFCPSLFVPFSFLINSNISVLFPLLLAFFLSLHVTLLIFLQIKDEMQSHDASFTSIISKSLDFKHDTQYWA